MSAGNPAEVAASSRWPRWFVAGVVFFALGTAHLAFQLKGLWVEELYSRLPEPVFRWLYEPSGAPRMMRVHRLWWALSVAAIALSIARHERPTLWSKVGLLALALLAWLLWELVLSIMGTF